MTSKRHICNDETKCKKCLHAKELREWRIKNKQKADTYQKEYNQKYYQENKEEIIKDTRNYYENNKEKQNNRKKEYRKDIENIRKSNKIIKVT
jgi:hypothetical protein